MKVYCVLFILLLVTCVTGEGVWCRNLCADIEKFEIGDKAENFLEHVPVDFVLHPDCKVKMCDEGEVCNKMETKLTGDLKFASKVTPQDFTMDIKLDVCGRLDEGHKLSDAECKTTADELGKALGLANTNNAIDFLVNKYTASCDPVSVCKENCVPAECLPQDDDKDKDKERYNTATCSSVSALLVTGAAILLH